MWAVSLPTTVSVSKAKRIPLNLNYYRNAHHQVLDKAKKRFKAEVAALVRELPKLPPVQITYILYVPTRRSLDVANVCSIVDKFFCDALVELGRLPDDDYSNVVRVSYAFGGVDRTDPRVDATIEPYEEIVDSASIEPAQSTGENPGPTKEIPLKISLVQTEIEEAVRAHIRSMIHVREGMDINMVFSATRGEDGLTAAIDIVPSAEPAPAQTSAQPAARTPARTAAQPAAAQPAQTAQPARAATPFRRPAAAAPAPAPVAEPVAEPEPELEREDLEGLDESEGFEGPEHEDPETPPAPASTGPKTSIFAGLKRPTNRPEAAAATAAAE